MDYVPRNQLIFNNQIKDGEPNDEISKYTDLTDGEIEKLRG